jgi:hypothetical protein
MKICRENLNLVKIGQKLKTLIRTRKNALLLRCATQSIFILLTVTCSSTTHRKCTVAFSFQGWLTNAPQGYAIRTLSVFFVLDSKFTQRWWQSLLKHNHSGSILRRLSMQIWRLNNVLPSRRYFREEDRSSHC